VVYPIVEAGFPGALRATVVESPALRWRSPVRGLLAGSLVVLIAVSAAEAKPKLTTSWAAIA